MNKVPSFELKSTSRQSGFNLLEICIALILLGVVLGAAFDVYKQHQNEIAIQVTADNMHTVVKALGNFVQTNNRLPCPTDPASNDGTFGFESGAAAATITGGRPPGNCMSGGPGVRNGLVPYQALNIPYEAILDGWGRYLTYGVSPVFTQPNEIFRDELTINTELVTSPGPDGRDDGDVQFVHQKCREAGWINSDEDAANGPKARFCCAFSTLADTTNDLVIRNRDNGQTISPSRAANSDLVYSVRMNKIYRSFSRALTSTPGKAGEGEVEAAAYALVSHGDDGYCAFTGDGTSGRINCAAPASADEIANGNGQTFYTGERKTDFDDIVIWMTQFGAMATEGANSCNLP